MGDLVDELKIRQPSVSEQLRILREDQTRDDETAPAENVSTPSKKMVFGHWSTGSMTFHGSGIRKSINFPSIWTTPKRGS